ncbi:DUF3150 domain-containing protein [Enterovibrio norvegicus]|uniref:DUF3150 domain-containing protein n=1 Tax=Enterovibrio norvegicus TaxID=188144 RepID=UPI00352F2386
MNQFDSIAANQTRSVGTMREKLEEGLAMVEVVVRGRDGERTPADARVYVEDMEVEGAIARNGRVQWFPSDALKFKQTFYTRANRLIASFGVNYGRIKVVPVSFVEELQEGLQGIKAEFDDELEKLRDNFDAHLDQHCDANPDSERLIRQLAMTADEFLARFEFKILSPMAFKPFFEDDDMEAAGEIKDVLLDDLASAAKELYENSFAGNNRVSQKAVNALKNLRSKVSAMSFIDDRLDKIVEEMDVTFDALPKAGYVTDRDFLLLSMMVQLMSNRDTLEQSICVELPEPEAEPEAELETNTSGLELPITGAPANNYAEAGHSATTSGLYW